MTACFGVAGWPVGHSLSPAVHNAALRHLGADAAYVSFEVPPARSEGIVGAMRCLGVSGMSVTMPHKQVVARSADRLSAVAALLGSANTLTALGGGLVAADSTDGEGLLAALAGAGVEVDAKRCLVVGTGAAARAVAAALAGAGGHVVVAGRSRAAVCRVLKVSPGARSGEVAEAIDAELVVNATPLGMRRAPGLPVPPDRLGPGQVVVDLVYDPPVTELLTAARYRGAIAMNGLPMLVHQAARQLELWLGQAAPVDVMFEAAEEAISGRQHGA
ncbi:MAG: shikimate dehydrogenase family protein [Acidimicrobiales bacterium]